jgi:tRNA threonylcarbamoyladenosine biosynthesis protein TsaE
MRRVGADVAAGCRAGDVVLLVGPLGAGKTTFTQGLARGLGVRGPVTSPTFVIAREHESAVGGPGLVHVDAYRLGGLRELDDLDLAASTGESVTVVEWGAGLVEHLDSPVVTVTIERAVGDAAPAAPDATRDAGAPAVPDGEPRVVVVEWPEGRT